MIIDNIDMNISNVIMILLVMILKMIIIMWDDNNINEYWENDNEICEILVWEIYYY